MVVGIAFSAFAITFGIVHFQIPVTAPATTSRDRKKPGELCGSRLILGFRIESRIPLLELASEFFIQHLCPYLQEQMGAAATPTHLLFFDEPFAQNLIHRRFDKGR